MSIEQWQIVAGVATAAVLTLAPWMLMVHAKLAVIAARLADLTKHVEKAAEANHELWSLYAQHQARLETHDVQFSHLGERLENV
jgi:Tfp pilus assembly protein PilN